MVESKRFLGKVGFDEEVGLYRAEVLHLCEKEVFFAASVDELRQQLRESVHELGRQRLTASTVPAESSGDTILLCLEPALFLQLSRRASHAGKKLDQYIIDILQEVVDQAPLAQAV